MKILLLNYEFPPLGGGAGNATKHIARELSRAGHTVLVITSGFKDLPREEEQNGYRVLRLPARRRRVDQSSVSEMLSFVWQGVWRGTAAARAFKPDYAIAFFAVPTGIVAWWWHVRLKVPYIISLRGGDVPGFLGRDLWWLHTLTIPVTALVWRGAAGIVANSRGLQTLAQKTANRLRLRHPIAYIPNGVDTEFFAPGSGPVSPARILFVGRLVRQKGVTFLLAALAQLRAAHPKLDVQCDIVGDGPLKRSLQQQAQDMGIAEAVTFPGWVDKEILREYYQRAAVFVLPSYEEGMPNVVLEAMACGLPVIGTRVAGTEELVRHGENGFLCAAPNDTNLLVYLDKILTYASGRVRMGFMGRTIARTYAWSQITPKYLTSP